MFKLLKPNFILSNIFTKTSSHHMQTFLLARVNRECCKKNIVLGKKFNA